MVVEDAVAAMYEIVETRHFRGKVDGYDILWTREHPDRTMSGGWYLHAGFVLDMTAMVFSFVADVGWHISNGCFYTQRAAADVALDENGKPYQHGLSFSDQLILEAMFRRATGLMLTRKKVAVFGAEVQL